MNLKIDGGILAGGLSTRMSGKDKGLQLFQGKMMAESVADVLRPHVDTLLINCNRNEQVYSRIPGQLCSDLIDGYKGPLAGIHSLLSHSDADYLLISPCDTPGLGEAFCQRMLAQLQVSLAKGESPKAFAVRTKDKDHPLHLLIHRSCLASLETSIKKGHFKVMKWMAENGVKWVDFEDKKEMFMNHNTLESLGR